jgi:hypothetical protein
MAINSQFPIPFMKKASIFLFGSFLLLLLVAGCTTSGTYADLLKTQSIIIRDYIKQNDIQLTSTLPAANAWKSNEYCLTPTGLYYRLLNPGDTTTDSIRAGDRVSVRYLKISITTPPDTVENTWTTLTAAYPYIMTYRVSDSGTPAAWQEAVSYMKYSGSEAQMIVPGNLGFSAEQSSITPFVHIISILKVPGQD